MQPASHSEESSTEEQPGDLAEQSSTTASSVRSEAVIDEESTELAIEADRSPSQIIDTETAGTAGEPSSSTSEQSTGTEYAMHRQPVVSPVVDEYCQIMVNSVSWTGELLMQFLRMPMVPRGNRLMDLRLAAHMDPSNAEK